MFTQFQVVFFTILLIASCESSRIEKVIVSNDKEANNGQQALIDALMVFAKNRKDPKEYATFARKVDELSTTFSREVKLEADLRLYVSAIAPLQSKSHLPEIQQMKTLAMTVWPTILNVSTVPGEKTAEYIQRLCQTRFSLLCHNLIPEYWPTILNAHVWRTLRKRILVAHERCEWCINDPKFGDILEISKKMVSKLEFAAHEAEKQGSPSAWPRAGKHAFIMKDTFVIAFSNDGTVRLDGKEPEGGNWRKSIGKLKGEVKPVAVSIRPERMVGDLVRLVQDLRPVGVEEVLLMCRSTKFPYEPMYYRLSTKTKSYKNQGVHHSYTVQVLVQALDFSVSKE